MLLPPDLSTSTFAVLETGGLGGIRPGLACCVSRFGSRPRAGEKIEFSGSLMTWEAHVKGGICIALHAVFQSILNKRVLGPQKTKNH